MDDKDVVFVCSSCLRSSCWQGISLCDESRWSGVIPKTVKDLRILNLESPSFWSKLDRESMNKVGKNESGLKKHIVIDLLDVVYFLRLVEERRKMPKAVIIDSVSSAKVAVEAVCSAFDIKIGKTAEDADQQKQILLKEDEQCK